LPTHLCNVVIYAGLDKLFAGRVMQFVDNVVTLRYDYGTLLKRLGPDFELEGDQPRYEAGSYALRMDGARKQILHKVPFEGGASIELELFWDFSLQKRSRLSLFVLDADEKGSAVQSPFALELSRLRKGRPAARAGRGRRSPLDIFKSNENYMLRLDVAGEEATASLDGEATARLGTDPVKSARAGVVFERVNVLLRAITVTGRINREWALRRLEQLERRGPARPRARR